MGLFHKLTGNLFNFDEDADVPFGGIIDTIGDAGARLAGFSSECAEQTYQRELQHIDNIALISQQAANNERIKELSKVVEAARSMSRADYPVSDQTIEGAFREATLGIADTPEVQALQKKLIDWLRPQSAASGNEP